MLGSRFIKFLPGGGLKLGEQVLWSFGVGVGAMPAGNRLVYKCSAGGSGRHWLRLWADM
jgi:hypothetical protein